MTLSQTSAELASLTSQDSSDLLSYLLKEDIPGADGVMRVVNTPQGRAALENVVLQIARAYAICAYEQNADLELLTPRLINSLEEYPDLAVVLRLYESRVDLRSVNEDIEEEALVYQTERLKEYLAQFLDN